MKETIKATVTTMMVALGMMLIGAESDTPQGTLLLYVVFIAYAFIFYVLYNHTNLYKSNEDKDQQSEATNEKTDNN